MAPTVVPKASAISNRVSPACTVYSVEDGPGVGVEAVVVTGSSGMLIVWPIWRTTFAEANPLKATMASTVVPKASAIVPKVSPACTVCSVEVGPGVGVEEAVAGSSGGMLIVWPIWRITFAEVNPFRATMASTVVPKASAIVPKVSPACTVCSVEVGPSVGVGVDVGCGAGVAMEVGVDIGVGAGVATTVGAGLAGLGRGKVIVSVGASACVNVPAPSSGAGVDSGSTTEDVSLGNPGGRTISQMAKALPTRSTRRVPRKAETNGALSLLKFDCCSCLL